MPGCPSPRNAFPNACGCVTSRRAAVTAACGAGGEPQEGPHGGGALRGGGRGSSARRVLPPPSPPRQRRTAYPPRWPLQPRKTGTRERGQGDGGGRRDTSDSGLQSQLLWDHACGDKDGHKEVPRRAWGGGWCPHGGSAPRSSLRARRRRRLLPFTRGGQTASELHPCKY